MANQQKETTLESNARGIRVAVLALLPLATGVISSCPAYGPLGISTLKEK